MKKIFYTTAFLFVLIFNVLLVNFNFDKVNASDKIYAQIKNSNTYLYKSAELSNGNNNVICLLEKTYFVEILSKTNEICYKVNYLDLVGYVSCSDVELVNETPMVPFPTNIKFDVYDLNNCYLRSSPEVINTNIIITINKGTKSLTYLGKIFGEEVVDFGGNVWYLAKYNDTIGYIYSKYTTNLNAIYPNTEKVTNLYNTFTKTFNPLSNFNCLLIIFLTLIPAVIILYLMYKPNNNFKKVKVNPKENIQIVDSNNFYDENL